MNKRREVLLIDNYDSFTYNLAQAFQKLGAEVAVKRNDQISVRQAISMKPTHLVVSPGPCTPNEAGVSNDLILAFSARVPVLGVCLGHQCIAQAFGAKIVRAPRPVHGKASPVMHDGKTIFRGIKNPFTAMRYHSLAVLPQSLPAFFGASAWSEDGVLMGFRHNEFCLEGVQFHPESFGTAQGGKILRNFLSLSGGLR